MKLDFDDDNLINFDVKDLVFLKLSDFYKGCLEPTVLFCVGWQIKSTESLGRTW